MDVITQQTTTIIATGVAGLAPISVFLTDLSLNKGKVVIECGGKGWANTWVWMNGKPVSQWFAGLSPASIAANFDYFNSKEVDFEKLPEFLKGSAWQLVVKNQLGEDKFLEIEAQIDELKCFIGNDLGSAWCTLNSDLLEDVLGEEWWEIVPQKQNDEYIKMIEIIKAAQASVVKVSNEGKYSEA